MTEPNKDFWDLRDQIVNSAIVGGLNCSLDKFSEKTFSLSGEQIINTLRYVYYSTYKEVMEKQ
jgi:hypothetical protein